MALPGGLLSFQKEEPSDRPEWGPCKCVSEDRSQDREVRSPDYTWGVWGPVLCGPQSMVVSLHLAPCNMASQGCGCRDRSSLLRALGLLRALFTPAREATGSAPP